MFYLVSKVVWFIVNPVNFLILLSAIGVFLLFTPLVKLGRRVLMLTIVGFAIIGFTPLGFVLLNTLEDAYSTPESIEQIDGIIVLGGGVDWLVSNGRNRLELAGGADRMVAAVALHKQFPNSKLLYSGRNRFLDEKTQSDALNTTSYFLSMGIPESKLYIEGRSRNTDENARFSKEMANPTANEKWILVTSAFHMKRAMMVFKKSGWNVLPYPVDYRSPGKEASWPFFMDTLNYMDNVSIALKEWLGIFIYRLSGRI